MTLWSLVDGPPGLPGWGSGPESPKTVPGGYAAPY